MIELFCNGDPTGQVAFVQIKGTGDKIQALKHKDEISCSISTSNAKYAMQKNVPIILIYAAISEPREFYYTDLNHTIGDADLKKIEDQKTITVHIPVRNKVLENAEPLFENIRDFYKEGDKL